ncbi:DUF4177 domain-containing protein [Sphingopyxis yananensis]|uniref:DUF4177 domain-containing protein n=1 Tax=Sphingopyxis yananensis TaxID=2886687 RepID=UPI001D12A540|nr:DUF4177 domain-containing protein [Sphingopyxis yananensis]MCC2601301.1 DUF4177 domain-containing protein [Sphingopyxis yananensis]
MAADGWRMIFMSNVMQRHLVTSDRETLMITFERKVPESEQEARAARCIDDVIAAEDRAKRVGHRAVVGAVGLVAGTALLGSLLSNGEGA